MLKTQSGTNKNLIWIRVGSKLLHTNLYLNCFSDCFTIDLQIQLLFVVNQIQFYMLERKVTMIFFRTTSIFSCWQSVLTDFFFFLPPMWRACKVFNGTHACLISSYTKNPPYGRQKKLIKIIQK